jgi:peptidoglycan/LPS O-acetylase OafA/YrhL
MASPGRPGFSIQVRRARQQSGGDLLGAIKHPDDDCSGHKINQAYTQRHMQNTKHLARLTGIRAVAALFVVFLHYRNDLETFLPSTKILDPLFSAGDLGVDLFFMLSGFILMLNYEQKFRRFALPEYRKFLWTRLARIYPVHVFTLFFLTALVLFARHLHQPLHHPEWYTLPAWLQNVFLLQAWTGIAQTLSWNFPAWSISAEWFAYLFFPLAVPVLLGIKRPIFAVAVALLAYLAVAVIHGDQPLIPLALLRVSCEFVAGCALYLAFEKGFRVPGNTACWGILIMVFLWTAEVRGIPRVLILPVFAILIVRLAANSTGFLSGAVAGFWGEASYALYMTHGICQEVLERLLRPAHFATASFTMRWMVLASYALAIAGAAILTYLCVERPARTWMRNVYHGAGRPEVRVTPEIIPMQS